MEINTVNSIRGKANIPGDKSISHRSAIISSLTENSVAIKNFLFSEDCMNTLEVLRKLGVSIEKINGSIIVHGKGIKKYREPEDILYVGNSGTTIRLLSGVLCASGFNSILSGDSSINKRPMGRIIQPLREMGAKIFGRDNDTRAPIIILKGEKLKGKKFVIDISSAQVKSCIALAGLFAEGATEIIQPEVSRDHTERMLEFFNAEIEYDGKYTRIVPGKKLEGRNIFIPGDISSAAYFVVASLILKKSRLVLKDIGINPTRSHFLDILMKMGANIEIKNRRIMNNEEIADIESSSSFLKGLKIEKCHIPNIIDEIPVLCVAAAFASGETVIEGAGELRFKESDRLNSITSQFRKAGVEVYESGDCLNINGNSKLKPEGGRFESFGDHRIAMSLAILGLKSSGTFRIMNSECIDTSFPGFKYELKNLVH
ncbi:MAG: 3-phosphoshikimate 1-carboxyvinyltransferase [Actinobacteria bacterium]|nr:3-phosphoshikimate 1-carboxyvinyltransferase [Actinomycetota bacterium]